MNHAFSPMRELPNRPGWKSGDIMVVFGELFSRGYVNGLVAEAQKIGMKVIYSTVGRRDDQGRLRPLTSEELKEKDQPLINIPLEAGFDLEPDDSGKVPIDQLHGLKLGEWDQAKLNWPSLQVSRERARNSFRERTQAYILELEKFIPDSANILFVHTMAGGVPRAKIVLPAMNRIFKGSGDRYASSEDFWKTDLGRFCDQSFMDVTAETYKHLIELSTPLRERAETRGRRVSYVAYGYHGTDVLVGSKYQWQSYAPYLQGFAKLRLEAVARESLSKGIRASVYNAPEILTNSSSVFLGVEISLYPLLGALENEAGGEPHVLAQIDKCLSLLKTDFTLPTIMDYTGNYFSSPIIQAWSKFDLWPQHNGPEQMAAMRTASTDLINMHHDPKSLMTATLSEIVFTACGGLMLAQSWEPAKPVWWLGHDIVAKQVADNS